MVEAQDLDLRACASNAHVCDTRGIEKLQRLFVAAAKSSLSTMCQLLAAYSVGGGTYICTRDGCVYKGGELIIGHSHW